MPVRVDIAVHPEMRDQRRPVRVVYRDPGFLGPIIAHSVGLVGAAVAAPFRIVEMLCLGSSSTLPTTVRRTTCTKYLRLSAAESRVRTQVSGTLRSACPNRAGRDSPVPPQDLPSHPFLPLCFSAGMRTFHASCTGGNSDEEPPCAPQSLIGGLVNLPYRLMERGRFLGDVNLPVHGVQPWNQ